MPAKQTAQLLLKLRTLMKDVSLLNGAAQQLSAYIIPSSDAHSSEYLSERDKRREYISGFSGSSGTAVVTQQAALLWTDGRYFVQAAQELDANWQLMKDGLPETPSIGQWLADNLPASSLVGIDATLYEEDLFQTVANRLRPSKIQLWHTKQNLIDLVWADEPNRPVQELKALLPLDPAHCGLSTSEKLARIRDQLKQLNAYATCITSLDEIAWLLNIRGFDIPFGAVFFAYAIITLDDAKIFANLNRFEQQQQQPALKQLLLEQEAKFEFYEYDTFYAYFEEFVRKELVPVNRKIYLSNSSNHYVHSLVPPELVHKDLSLVGKMKIIKNECEIAAARRVHIRDSCTLVEFFYKLDRHFEPGSNERDFFGVGQLDEFKLGAFVDALRATRAGFLTPSFETISSIGPNGAIIHYKPKQNDENTRVIEANNLVLVDSGGHYVDMGTTDVTRTVYIGDKQSASAYLKECFTRVLKGHIQLSSRVFPANTRAELLDSFARQALWQAGLDYRHGTGHGVGALLNVHEIPIMSNRKSIDLGLQENMIVTIEPGYYETDQFGIRIENCVLTVKANTKYKYASNVEFITFEPLTYVPIQRELVEKSLLDANELVWLNEYNRKCAEIVGDELRKEGKQEVFEWLLEQTRPL